MDFVSYQLKVCQITCEKQMNKHFQLLKGGDDDLLAPRWIGSPLA